MAKVNKETRNEEVVKIQEKTVFVLELDEDEAKILVAVLGHIGGNPDGPRGVINKIYRAVKDGVGHYSFKNYGPDVYGVTTNPMRSMYIPASTKVEQPY